MAASSNVNRVERGPPPVRRRHKPRRSCTSTSCRSEALTCGNQAHCQSQPEKPARHDRNFSRTEQRPAATTPTREAVVRWQDNSSLQRRCKADGPTGGTLRWDATTAQETKIRLSTPNHEVPFGPLSPNRRTPFYFMYKPCKLTTSTQHTRPGGTSVLTLI